MAPQIDSEAAGRDAGVRIRGTAGRIKPAVLRIRGVAEDQTPRPCGSVEQRKGVLACAELRGKARQ